MAALSVAMLLLSGCSFHDAEAKMRFGWPTGITTQGTRMRVLYTWAGVAALALGVIVWGLIFWCCIRYRHKKSAPDDYIPRQTKYNLGIELTCIVIPFIIIIGLFWRTVVVENDVNKLSAHPDVLVTVDGFKWNWQFEYDNYRSASGAHTQAVYGNAKNKITGTNGALHLSTVGSDDEVPVLVIPIHQSVQFIEHSEDVIHSFWVPEFLFKRDVIPYGTDAQQAASGLSDNRFQINATTLGSYVGRCAELCGTYHAEMDFEVRVVTASTFRNYLAALKRIGPSNPARQSMALKAAGMTPYATTTYPFNTDRTARSASEQAAGS